MDDLRTTNQIGNASLQAMTAATSSSMTASASHGRNSGFIDAAQRKTEERNPNAPMARAFVDNLGRIGDGLNKIADSIGNLSKSGQQGIMLSTKAEPDIVGFNNDAIAKLCSRRRASCLRNDDHIILDDEFLGKDPGSLNSNLFQIKFPEWTAEKIELPLAGATDPIKDFKIRVSDPTRPVQPLELAFSNVIQEDIDIGADMTKPGKADSVAATFRKLKAYLDAQIQHYYGSVEAVVSLGVEDFDYDTKHITKLSLVVSSQSTTPDIQASSLEYTITPNTCIPPTTPATWQPHPWSPSSPARSPRSSAP